MKTSIYVLTKETTKEKFTFFDNRKVELLSFDLENPYYSYYANDDSFIEVNKPNRFIFHSYGAAWKSIKRLLQEGYEMKKIKVDQHE